MTFAPPRSAISNISQGYPARVTTATAHGLATGQAVRLHVPIPYGMPELNQRQVSIIVDTDRQFLIYERLIPVEVPINTTEIGPFVDAPNQRFTAEVLSMGSAPCPVLEPFYAARNNTCETLVNDATFNNSTVEIPF